ncbi:Brassinosteroid signaling positive regulator-related protein [Dorcoceras hygrometricum]|uniref:Brassinosteroid signaling positive regulator-related protein n=1 Tax=Dorcoceras hygrometricum TaxID=472368 RepID=A0A2Z7BVF1_9LAMI|nr:Brassinosteroid signaling positive regulator-related protein [Dorcoceras hygrometricum]
MASSFYSNTLHVDFDSVLAMDNPGMVSVFNALMASGLEGFLGCPAVLYEAALVEHIFYRVFLHISLSRVRIFSDFYCKAFSGVLSDHLLSAMASSFYSNTLHVDFDSVLAMDNPGMVSVFNALMASGLEGFLGCPAVLYEAALVDFFNNGSVSDGLVVSSVNGVPVEITEQLLAETFELPLDGLSELSEIPRDKVFDAKSIVSLTGEPVSTSGKKSQLKIEYRLLCDIMAKTISVKAGSFNAITMEKFLMLTAVVCELRVNWSSVLFNILKKMVTAGSKQGKVFAVQISLLLENIPNLELGKSSEFPSSKILIERTIHRYIVLNDKVGAQEAADVPKVKKAPRKRPAVTIADEPMIKKKRTTKKKIGSSKASLEMVAVAQEMVPIQMIEPIPAAPAADYTFDQPVAEDEILLINQLTRSLVILLLKKQLLQVIAETAQMGPAEEDLKVDASADGGQQDDTNEEKQWFDLRYEDIMAQMDADRPVVTPSDTDEEVETMDVGTVGGDQQVQIFVKEPEDEKISDDEQSVDEGIDADEAMSLEDILLSIPVDVPLPLAGVEITKIVLGQTVYIPGVDEGDWYNARLPKIHPEEKGKEPLQLKDPAKGKPPLEHYSLICADIQLLEALVLSWAEAESIVVALQRKMYILLKYREVLVRKFLESWTKNFVPGEGTSAVDLKVIHLLSDLNYFILEELKQQTVAHGLRWNKTCCSQLFEGRSRTPSAAPATTNFAVSRQRSYDDTLPLMSAFFKLMKKRWGDVCLEVAEFCVSRRLLPVGTINFFRALSVFEPVGSFVLHQPTVFALRLSQFCTVFFEYSLFSRFSSEDITSFVAFIASEITNLRSVQITTPSAVAPRVPILLDKRSSSTSSSDESMYFDDQDTATAFSLPAATLPSLPAVTTELSTSLDDLRIFLSERFDNQAEAIMQIDDAQSDVISRLHTIKRDILAALMQQEEAFRNLINTARQDGRTLDDAHTLCFNEFSKVVLAQSVSDTADMLEVLKEIKALDAKVTSLDEQVAATRNDLLEFSGQAQQTLNIVTDQLSEIVAYINRGGNDKKGEVSSSRPPPDDQNRGSGNTGGGGDTDRNIVERLITADRERERSRGNISGSYKRRRY